jgi:RimJ/RimL family protein N-acetyltransferase
MAAWNPWKGETCYVSQEEMEQRKAGKLRLIGVIGIVREQEIGYKIHTQFWGKGYMSEALRMFIEMWWGWKVFSLSRVNNKKGRNADPGDSK